MQFTIWNKSTFLHNAKTPSSKIAEDKDRKSYENHPQGRCTSHVETTHQMLKCPEVMTDLFFTSVSTMPLECRTGIELDMLAVVSDSSQIGSASNDMRSTKEGIQECRQDTANELLIYEDLKKSKVTI